MKSSPILIVTLLGALGLTTPAAHAAPRAAEASGSHYLFAADNLGGWHLGGFYRYADRNIDDFRADTFTQNKFAVHVGRDLLSWISIYGYLGSTSVELDPGPGGNDPTLEYGGGVWANLLDHDLLNNLMLETRLRVQALFQVSAASPEVYGRELDYTEYYGTLTLSLVNELIGNKNYWPDAIGLFFGPVFNEVNCDEIDFTGGGFGLTGGLDFYLTRNTTLSLSYETSNSDNVMNVAVNLRF